jgi:hypothetical protein
MAQSVEQPGIGNFARYLSALMIGRRVSAPVQHCLRGAVGLIFFVLVCGVVVPALMPALADTVRSADTDSLKDPTRPANIVVVDDKTVVGSAEVTWVLQSILMAPKRQVAIINGQTVALHGKIGTYTLSHLTETEAVLHRTEVGKRKKSQLDAGSGSASAQQRITLQLFPDFEKKRILKNNSE